MGIRWADFRYCQFVFPMFASLAKLTKARFFCIQAGCGVGMY